MNQTATPSPVVDYVPQKQYPSFSIIINQNMPVTKITGTGVTLTAAQILAGLQQEQRVG